MDDRSLAYLEGQEINIETNEGAYAWGGTAIDIVKPHLAEVTQNTVGPIVIVDLCSSYPILAQILKDAHIEECRIEADKTVIKDLVVSIQTFKHNHELPSMELMPDGVLRSFRQHLMPRHSDARQLLTGIVQDILVTPPDGDDIVLEDELTAMIKREMITRKHTYEKIWELEHLVGQGRWQSLEPVEADMTFEECIAALIQDTDVEQQVIDDLTLFLSRRILPRLRSFNVKSVDMEDPDVLKNRAERSFPEWYQNTKFYRRAGNFGSDHIQANIFDLNFPVDSISLFTSFEGYPFYFGNAPLQPEQTVFASRIERSLKPGGKAIFFPWATETQTNIEETKLGYIEWLWRTLGLKVTKSQVNLSDLTLQMSLREQILTQHSPIFRNYEEADILVVEKPI